MTRALSDPLLSELSGILAARTGLDFPKERWNDLERAIGASAPDFGATDARSCAHRLLSAPLTQNQIEILASHLTVGETYFFREPNTFAALEEQVFPALLQARNGERRLRIWSAGCCTGEEPYSIALLLDRLIPQPQDWNVTILATDINPAFLRKAAQGVYGEWSFRGTPAWLRERYFKKKKDGRFELAPSIRKRVTFSYLNLAEDAYPSLTNNTNAMDLILCRNVLMYFSAARARTAVDHLHRSLVDGGWLIVSPVETSSRLFSGFSTVSFPGAVFYRKTAVPQPAGAAPWPSVGSSESPLPALPPEPARAPKLEPSVAPPLAPPQPAASQSQMAPRGEPAHLARTYANDGRLTEAMEWCEKAVAADKLNPAHHYLLATLRRELGQNTEAVQSLQRALYLDPDFVLAHFALGTLRLSQGRRQEAQRHLDNALALLHAHSQNDPLPESDGLTAGRLRAIIISIRASLPRRGSGPEERQA